MSGGVTSPNHEVAEELRRLAARMQERPEAFQSLSTAAMADVMVAAIIRGADHDAEREGLPPPLDMEPLSDEDKAWLEFEGPDPDG